MMGKGFRNGCLLVAVMLMLLVGTLATQKQNQQFKQLRLQAQGRTTQDELVVVGAPFSAVDLTGKVEGTLGNFAAHIESVDTLKTKLGTEFVKFMTKFQLSLKDSAEAFKGDYEDAFVHFITKFFTRLVAQKANMIQTLGLTADFKVTDIEHSGSDPHGELDSLMIITTTGAKKFVYKPSSVDGHYYTQGENDHSFTSILNAQIGNNNKPHLPTFKVMSITENDGHKYGFIEYLNKRQEVGDLNSFKDYSYRAGVLSALAYLAGVVDLHYENIMVTVEGPIIIDAEAAFSPRNPFTLTSTELFDSKTGAFIPKVNDADRASKANSDITYYGAVKKPLKAEIRQGFADTINFIKDHQLPFVNWIDGVPNTAAARYVLMETPIAFEIRKHGLKARAGGQALVTAKAEITNQFYLASRLDKDAFEHNLHVPLYSMFEQDDATLLPGLSVPASFVKVGERFLYYHDLTTYTSLVNCPPLPDVVPREASNTGNSERDKFYNDIRASQIKQNTGRGLLKAAAKQLADQPSRNVLEQTPKALCKARIQALAAGNGAADLIAAFNTETNNFAEVPSTGFTGFLNWVLSWFKKDPYVQG